MLRPLRNFISYLQKNASSAVIFGVTPAMSEEAKESSKEMTLSTPDDKLGVKDKDQVSSEDVTELGETPDKPSKDHDQNENVLSPSKDCAVENDDLEKEKGLENKDVEVREETISEAAEGESSKNIRSDTPPVIDGDSLTAKEDESIKDLVSQIVDTSTEEVIDENLIVDELITINDETTTDISDSNIEEQLQDPLAIEEYQADISGSMNNSNSLHSTNPDMETSTEGEIVFVIDVHSIKNNQEECKKDDVFIEPIVINSDNEICHAAIATQLDEINEEQEVRSDGSDSGLGAETIGKPPGIPEVDGSLSLIPIINKPPPSRGNLKRRNVEIVPRQENNKRAKKSITFDGGVTIFYFPRMQGFACVPSQGGCTLGMGSRHVSQKKFTLAEHAAEQRRVHKQHMQEINPRGSSSDETDSDEEISEASGSDLDADGTGFLLPVSTRQRRAILKAAGVRRIDTAEKDECRAIRGSREFCGCSCNSFCDPDTCTCSLAGIKCQVDRPNFPCGCTRDGCANVIGRVEFNPSRVRTHYIHTIMRLGLENKQKRSNDMIDGASVAVPSLSTYANSCGSANINSSVSSNNDNINNLNNVCNYNNHLRTSQYGQSLLQHLLNTPPGNHTSYSNGVTHSNMYPDNLNSGVLNQLLVEDCGTTQTHLHQSHSAMHHNSNTFINNSQNNHNISSSNDNCNTNSNSNSITQSHPNELHYPFREVGVDCTPNATTTPCNTENSSIGMYFPATTNNQLYHDTYTSNNYINNSYTTSNTNVSTTYCSYQQTYINYASACNNQIPDEIYDLNSTDEDGTDYINLHPPVANSERLDAINDLLQTNRNTTPTESAPNASSDVVITTKDSSVSEKESEENSTTKSNPSNMNFEQKFEDFIDVVICDPYHVDLAKSKEKIKEENPENSSKSLLDESIVLSSSSSLLVSDPSMSPKKLIPPTSASTDTQNQSPPNLESLNPFEDTVPCETDENLSEIIKKSIVETVTA